MDKFYVFICDKGIDGILSALFIGFTKKITPIGVYAFGQTEFPKMADIIKVGASVYNKERVKKALFKYAGKDVLKSLIYCINSKNENAYFTAYKYAYLILSLREDVKSKTFNPTVSDFFNCVNDAISLLG